jgi:hypothetical protein
MWTKITHHLAEMITFKDTTKFAMDEAISWLSLKRFGSLRVLKTSYIWLVAVPLAAKILAAMPNKIHIPWFEFDIPLAIDLPFSWEAFYFSAVFFAIASFLFGISCPSIIKNYDSFTDYEAEGRGFMTLKSEAMRTLVRAINERPSPSINWERGTIAPCYPRTQEMAKALVAAHTQLGEKLSALKLEMGDANQKKNLGDLFHYVQEKASMLSVRLRIACTFFYFGGFVLIGMVTLQNLVTVLKIMNWIQH